MPKKKPDAAEKQMLDVKEILLPTLALFLICLVVTASLAVVNAVTWQPIAQNVRKDADAARKLIFPEAVFEDCGNYFAASKDGTLTGYCMEAEGQGYGGAIKVTVGLRADGTVFKIQVLAADEETPGLGQKVREDKFLDQFAEKSGTIALGDIDAIASATYSSQGVVDAVNQALEIYRGIGGEGQ